jgi:SAM-dependent methyltransferase
MGDWMPGDDRTPRTMRGRDRVEAGLGEQLAYYRARAPEYDRWSLRRGPFDRGRETNEWWFAEVEALRAALDAFGPRGRVLELACGTGQWTAHLARYADSLTAVDAAPEAIQINRARLDGLPVRHVQADLFEWRPSEQFDTVFFSFWLSHVPPERFEGFWDMVRSCLAPGGRVFLIDNLRSEAAAEIDPEAPGPEAGSVVRTLGDGRRFVVWKVLFTPEELVTATRALGWDLDVRPTGSFFLYASGTPAASNAGGR